MKRSIIDYICGKETTNTNESYEVTATVSYATDNTSETISMPNMDISRTTAQDMQRYIMPNLYPPTEYIEAEAYVHSQEYLEKLKKEADDFNKNSRWEKEEGASRCFAEKRVEKRVIQFSPPKIVDYYYYRCTLCNESCEEEVIVSLQSPADHRIDCRKCSFPAHFSGVVTKW